MKKLVSLFSSLLLVSCLSEPKKEIKPKIIIENKIVKDTIKNINIEATTCIDSSLNNNQVEEKTSFIIVLEKLVDGSINDFKDWTYSENYIFKGVHDYDNFKTYAYYNYKTKTNIIYNSRDNENIYGVNYETLNNEEYTLLQTQCKKNGYTKLNDEYFKGTVFHFYEKNKIYEISFNEEKISYMGQEKTAFTIAIENLKKKNDLK